MVVEQHHPNQHQNDDDDDENNNNNAPPPSQQCEMADSNALESLLGLLSIKEYFVTVDHSVLWQRHVAWAKPKGNDLKQYVTQRFASNMIVLSLMLGIQINVFFNSSAELYEMRTLLGSEKYGDVKYWVAIFIILDAVVTIMALIATFTLWGMILSISDSNTHALLRSSIGQCVISMPPRFVVAALYLFIFWLLLFLMDLMSGPAQIILPIVVLFLFFQVVLPLSAFGRLIIHTGAMAQRRVLEEALEKQLMPSGLHSALLIRAAGQRRKYSNGAIYQYRKQSKFDDADENEERDEDQTFLRTKRVAVQSQQLPYHSFDQDQEKDSTLLAEDVETPRQLLGRRNTTTSAASSLSFSSTSEYNNINNNSNRISLSSDTPFLNPSEEEQILHTAEKLMKVQKNMKLQPSHTRTVSGDVYFPRASILNAATQSQQLMDVVQQALYESERENSVHSNSNHCNDDDDILDDHYFHPTTTKTLTCIEEGRSRRSSTISNNDESAIKQQQQPPVPGITYRRTSTTDSCNTTSTSYSSSSNIVSPLTLGRSTSNNNGKESPSPVDNTIANGTTGDTHSQLPPHSGGKFDFARAVAAANDNNNNTPTRRHHAGSADDYRRRSSSSKQQRRPSRSSFFSSPFLMRENSSKSLIYEWEEETSVRDLYGEVPPPPPPPPLPSSFPRNEVLNMSEEFYGDDENTTTPMPVPRHRRRRSSPLNGSFYNRIRGGRNHFDKSLQNSVVVQEQIDKPKESPDDEKNKEEASTGEVEAGGGRRRDKNKHNENGENFSFAISGSLLEDNNQDNEQHLILRKSKFGEHARLLGERSGSVQYYTN